MKRLILFSSLFFLTVSCQAPIEAELTQDEKEGIASKVRQSARGNLDFGEKWNEENFAKWMNGLAETDDKTWVGKSAMWFNELNLLDTKESIETAWEPSKIPRQGTTFKIDKDWVAVLSPESALYTFKGSFAVINQEGITGNDIPLSGSFVYVLRDGQWKILHMHQSWKN